MVESIDSYRLISRALNEEISGDVLDVGNGGVFNYDVGQATRIVVVDIASELSQRTDWPPNAEFRWGGATELPVEDGSFDTCLLQLIVHHLAETSYSVTRRRSRAAIQEAFRAVRPGGKVVVLESCLPAAWEQAERCLFPAFRFVLQRINHPLVFQWSAASLVAFMQQTGLERVRNQNVPLGRWVIQLGVKWPTALTPVRVHKIVGYKSSEATVAASESRSASEPTRGAE